MDRICTSPEYRDTLSLILTKIKDYKTYIVFSDVCKNMRNVFETSNTPLYFRSDKRDDIITKFVSGESERIYSVFEDKITSQYINQTGNEYQYDSESQWKLCNVYQCKDGDDIKYYFMFSPDGVIKLIRVRQEIYGMLYDLINVVLMNPVKWEVIRMPSMRQEITGFERIPAEFTNNGATYFETEEGIKYLDKVKKIIDPYWK
jgi:hypothetical protein